MNHDGPLLPAYFAERESDSFFKHVFFVLNLDDTVEWIY